MSTHDFEFARLWGAFNVLVFEGDDPRQDARRTEVLSAVIDALNEADGAIGPIDLMETMMRAFHEDEEE